MREYGRGKNKETLRTSAAPSKSLLQPSPAQLVYLVLRGPWDKTESIFLCNNFFKILSLNTIPNPHQLCMPIVVYYWPSAPSHFPPKNQWYPFWKFSLSFQPLPNKYFFSFSLPLFFPPCLCLFFLPLPISKIPLLYLTEQGWVTLSNILHEGSTQMDFQ